jgi:predicted DNA-binding transcriptional regulator YafY
VVHVDRRRWFASPDDLPHLPALRRAAVDRRRVRITYASPREDAPRTRSLDPLGLVENGNRWYLVAYHRGAPRTYRLARVRALSVLEADARVPAGAVLAQVWDHLRKGFEARPGPPVTARLRIRTEAEDDLRGMLQSQVVADTELRVVRRTARHVELEADFRLRRSAIGWCLASAGDLEILAPPELRAEAVAAARASLDLLES